MKVHIVSAVVAAGLILGSCTGKGSSAAAVDASLPVDSVAAGLVSAGSTAEAAQSFVDWIVTDSAGVDYARSLVGAISTRYGAERFAAFSADVDSIASGLPLESRVGVALKIAGPSRLAEIAVAETDSADFIKAARKALADDSESLTVFNQALNTLK